MGQAGGLEPVQPQGGEGKARGGAHGAGHVAPPGMGLSHPVTEGGGLGDAAPYLAERQSAEQRMVALPEDEEWISLVPVDLLRVTPEAPAEGAARQIVGRPGRLPRGQEVAAEFAQPAPLLIVAHFARTEVDPLATDEIGIL